MSTTGQRVPGVAPSSRSSRWLARLAFLCIVVAALVLLVGAGFRSVLLVLVGVLGLGICAAGVWELLTSRTRLHTALALVAVAAPLVVLVLFAVSGLLWVVLVVLALLGAAGASGRAALSPDAPSAAMPEHEVAPPLRPFLIMNPRSGGGKVARFELDRKATELGAEVTVLDPNHPLDVRTWARNAVAAGADLLGVAGGDGTQALVAEVAAESGVPLLVVSAGTRNHFALDLGLDRKDPSRCLDALTDGVELRVDLGRIGDRTFVNNASFGAYAEIVRSPEYRDDKMRTTLSQLPDLLLGERGAHLRVTVDGVPVLAEPQAVLVSNNPYETDDIAGLSRRARLDSGRLGVSAVRIRNAREAARLLDRAHSTGLTLLTASDVIVDADVDKVPVGIDGESILMPTPVRCTVQPQALRVRVPRNRPGVPSPRAALDWIRLRRLALGRRPVAHDVVDAAAGHRPS
jgi:diacylglycerol kinase family enzyme